MPIIYTIILFFKIFFGLAGFENEKEYMNIQLFYTDNIKKSEVNYAIRIIHNYYSIDNGNIINDEFVFQLVKEENEYKFIIPINEDYFNLSEDEKEEFKKNNQLLVDELSTKIFNGDYVYFDLYDSYFNEIEGITNEGYKNESKTILNYIETGYVLDQEFYGDLNKDGIEDCVLLIKGTDKNKYIVDEYNPSIKKDRNRRGLIVLLNGKGNYDMIYNNNDCFFPIYDADEIQRPMNDDGTRTIIHPPELKIEIKNGNLYIKISEGIDNLEQTKYTFRFNKSKRELELIGFDCNLDSYVYGTPYYCNKLSINYLSKKINYLKAIGLNEGKIIYEDLWSDIEIKSLLKSSEINNFDNLEKEVLDRHYSAIFLLI